MSGDVRGFYAALGVTLPGSGTSGDVSVSCFASPKEHEHEDRSPSASVSLDTGQFACFACAAKGGPFDAALALGRSRADAAELAKRYDLFPTDREQPQAENGRPSGNVPVACGPGVLDKNGAQLPGEPQLAEWHNMLARDERLAGRLHELRGWTRNALLALELGFDGERVTFPVRDASGRLVGMLRYAPNPEQRTGKKMLAAKGSTRELFPGPETLPVGERVFIVEGEPDAVAGRSLGLAAVGVPGAGTWKAAWAARFAGRDVVILTDCDRDGRKLADAAGRDLLAHAASVRVVDLDSTRTDGYDVGDLVREAAQNGDAGPKHAARLIERMADTAEPLKPPGVEPTGELLDGVSAFLRRYVRLGDDQAVAIALWTLHTHAFDAAYATPYLTVLSAEKRSGKTRLIEVLTLLVRAGWHAAGASEAALFRKIADTRPTLLLDEVDAIFGSHSERTEPLRAILNAGNRPGASVARCVGEGAKQTVVDFPVYCAKLLAGIDTGRLPDTIADRAIKIEMKRKTKGEPVERLYLRDAEPIAEPLRDQLAAWARNNGQALTDARPELPGELDDRAGEAWEALFAIADHAGVDWPDRARAAALALSGGGEDDATSRGVQLLAAIHRAMGDRSSIATAELLETINADDELQFGGWREGKGLDARGLARLLRPYGVRSGTVRDGDKTPKGYNRVAFEDAWARYLSPSPESPPQAPQAPHTNDPPRKTPHEHWDVADVADVADIPGMGESHRHIAPNRRHNGAPAAAVRDAGEAIGLTDDCTNPIAHATHHRSHPDTGRTVCGFCHPLAATLASNGSRP